MNSDALATAIRELVAESAPKDGHPYTIGDCYFIRTVTMFHTGRLVAVYKNELVLEDAAWIADTDRFSDFLAGTVEAKEFEGFPSQVIVNRGAIIDVSPWKNKLPRGRK